MRRSSAYWLLRIRAMPQQKQQQGRSNSGFTSKLHETFPSCGCVWIHLGTVVLFSPSQSPARVSEASDVGTADKVKSPRSHPHHTSNLLCYLTNHKILHRVLRRVHIGMACIFAYECGILLRDSGLAASHNGPINGSRHLGPCCFGQQSHHT